MYKYLLWSSVMRSYFQIGEEIATSTSVEAAFADLKNRAFKGQLPMRADKFIQEHLDYVDGKIKLASCQRDIPIDYEQQSQVAHNVSSTSSTEMQEDNSLENSSSFSTINPDIAENLNDVKNDRVATNTVVNKDEFDCTNTVNKNELDCTDTVINKDELDRTDTVVNKDELDCNVYENWRGLIHQSSEAQCSTAKKRCKNSYLDKCPEWDYIKLSRDQNIPLMRNGSICKSVTIDKKIYSIHQTCAFDAILHLIETGIATIKNYENKITSLENCTINLALSILNTGKVLPSHYSERAKILLHLPLFNDCISTYIRTIFKLNTNCNVAHLMSYLFDDIPSHRITREDESNVTFVHLKLWCVRYCGCTYCSFIYIF